MLSIKLSRISTIGIAFSVVIVLPGLVSARFSPDFHLGLVGLGAGLIFPLSMYITFTGSLKSGRPRRGLEALLPIMAVALASSSVIAYLAGGPFRLLASSSLIALLGHTLMQVRGWRRGEPRLAILYPPLAGLASSLCDCSTVEWMLVLALFFAGAMVIVVSLFTVSRNYGVKPSRIFVWTPLALNAAGLAALHLGGPWTLLGVASMILYFAVLGVYKAPQVLARGLSIGGPGGGALAYTSASHLASLAPTLLALYPGLDLLSRLHLIYIGFIGVHIFLHAPLMLPQILRIKLSKTYTPLPTVLLAAAALARPWYGELSYLLVLASLAVLLAQFRPQGFLGPHRPRG
ncbi:MAG: hypothetical protein F7C09_01275 [Aeropyrum sp.]|nr:hypothetical protein [Aeropyrum sp.]